MARRGPLALALLAAGLLLAAAPAQAAFPGRNGKIAFAKEAAPGVTNDQVWTMEPDGSGQTNISNTSTDDERPAWSPDGKRIAFDRGAGLFGVLGGPGDIWVMNADGSGKTNLTGTASDGESHPSWSGDGTKIAFMRDGEIWTMNADGTDKKPITNPGSDETDFWPAWSPDSRRIAFTRLDAGTTTGNILLVNADGTGTPQNISNVTTAFSGDGVPNWSPDGSRITFTRAQNFFSSVQVHVMNADGSGKTNLSQTSTAFDYYSAWSPDGTRLAFSRLTGQPGITEIFAMNADGSGKQNLSNAPVLEDSKPDWQPLSSLASSAAVPACSPDGNIAVTVREQTGFISPPKAVHYRVDGGPETVVPTSGGNPGTATVTVPNGQHTLEYWGENTVGDQESPHLFASVLVDTANRCLPAGRLGLRATARIAGVPRACVSRNFVARVRIRSATRLRSVRVFLDGKLIKRTRRSSFRVRVPARRLRAGRHRLRVVAIDRAGRRIRQSKRFVRCARAKRRVPRFTG